MHWSSGRRPNNDQACFEQELQYSRVNGNEQLTATTQCILQITCEQKMWCVCNIELVEIQFSCHQPDIYFVHHVSTYITFSESCTKILADFPSCCLVLKGFSSYFFPIIPTPHIIYHSSWGLFVLQSKRKVFNLLLYSTMLWSELQIPE